MLSMFGLIGTAFGILFAWARSQASGRIADNEKNQERLDKFYADRLADKDRQIASLIVERDAFRSETFRALGVAQLSTSNTAKALGLDAEQRGTTT
jgi:hypothetical protein